MLVLCVGAAPNAGLELSNKEGAQASSMQRGKVLIYFDRFLKSKVFTPFVLMHLGCT